MNTSAHDNPRMTAGRRSPGRRSAIKIAASNSASITGTIQFGPTLNRAGNSSSTIIASTRAAASSHRFSAPIPVRTTSILDAGL